MRWLLGQPRARLRRMGTVAVERQRWTRHELRVEGYPAGMRRAIVVLVSTERQNWAGHYGAKVASPALRFVA